MIRFISHGFRLLQTRPFPFRLSFRPTKATFQDRNKSTSPGTAYWSSSFRHSPLCQIQPRLRCFSYLADIYTNHGSSSQLFIIECRETGVGLQNLWHAVLVRRVTPPCVTTAKSDWSGRSSEHGGTSVYLVRRGSHSKEGQVEVEVGGEGLVALWHSR